MKRKRKTRERGAVIEIERDWGHYETYKQKTRKRKRHIQKHTKRKTRKINRKIHITRKRN